MYVLLPDALMFMCLIEKGLPIFLDIFFYLTCATTRDRMLCRYNITLKMGYIADNLLSTLMVMGSQ